LGGRERLAAARHAEEHLKAVSALERLGDLGEGARLIAAWFEPGDELEAFRHGARHHSCLLREPQPAPCLLSERLAKLSSMPRFSLVVGLGLVAGACSLLNAPDEVIPGGGGQATTSSTGTGAACARDGDCAPSTDPCKKSVCAAGGACELTPVADA